MISEAVSVQRVVLYEGPQSHPFTASTRSRLISALLQRGFACSVRGSADKLGDFRDRKLIVLGQFPGALPDALARSDQELHVHNIAECDHDEVMRLVEQTCDQPAHSVARQWKPWFPVIDYDRCTNCMQCLSFCLFDVYGVTPEGQITVQNENNCKTDCPACSRVCPEVAILFPKYKAGPINGDEVSADDVRREAMKVDISAILGGDVYAMLRDRSAKAKSRFSRERDDDRALKERQRCLKKLQENMGGDVPPEVLASLPSFDEIQRKAEQAKQRAQSALDANQNRSSGAD